ncbi:oligopeptide transport system substrate-binding protein [Enterococcus sp. PF1-24]|uniref:peptide ABC transporter substrate-binding protein n=1 Tax=unclassified Enterococcus TaxID=2608891 RepID=UPI0024739713|nr:MULTISPECIES: ABC transporter substrate-binding protein [unclassified Enterococcus]MDH6363548.1 oligopeptide transport system substrate-binding protein [Enterococcus sp. PFB1-1]MDH6400783.1 oligopeptide transport system substrate-binding protein [Enterococcus sp. PF1-24]
MKKNRLFGTLLVCTLVLSACGGSKDAATGSTDNAGGGSTEQVFNKAVQQEMSTADLSLATDTISFSVLNNVYEGLYRLDADSQPQPAGAAEMAEISEDGLVYKLKLREDATWSNGDPVTAADYVYGWQRTADPETGSEYAYFYEKVANGPDVITGDKPVTDLGIKAIGDYELEITLEAATPYFPYFLAFPSFFPQHQATVEEFGDDYAKTSENAIYNGPFVLDNFDGPGVDTDWSYVKNDKYWDAETVQLDTINVSVIKEASTAYNLFEDGQMQDVILTGELAQQMANDPEFVSQKEATSYYIELNQIEEDSPFRNVNLRKAISYAIDRDALVTQILGDGSVASVGLVPEAMSFNPETGEDFSKDVGVKVEHDVEKAQEYWEKAKAELGIDSLQFELMSSDTDSTKKMTEYIQGVLQENLEGMTVKLSPVPLSVRIDRGNKGDFDILLGGWGADYADPSSYSDLFVTGNSYNRGRWSNEEYDVLVKDAAVKNANDPVARWQNLIDAEKVMLDQLGVIPVYQKAEGHMRATNLKGIVAHAAGAQYDYKWAYIEE